MNESTYGGFGAEARAQRRHMLLFGALIAGALGLFVLDLAVGSVNVGLRDVALSLVGRCPDEVTTRIVVDIRLVKALVALMAGMALAVSGLQMQTVFHNPLAGPYVLGVSSGASLAVAVFMLGAPLFGISAMASGGTTLTAWIGSAAVLALIAAMGRRVKDIMVVLILGMMVSSGVGAVVQILQFLSDDEALKGFVIWTMGALGNVTPDRLPWLAGGVVVGLAIAAAVVKPLNLLQLGDDYAVSLGIDLRRSRLLIFASTTLLAGTVTAFCGPIGFIGLAFPHIARAIFRDADHRVLVPASALLGGAAMLGCDVISKTLTLPINAITALIGIPVVIWIVLRNR